MLVILHQRLVSSQRTGARMIERNCNSLVLRVARNDRSPILPVPTSHSV